MSVPSRTPIIVAGSRNFTDYKKVCEILFPLFQKYDEVIIISGTARGADMLGEKFAQQHGILVRQFPADWARYGKQAGMKRNTLMAHNAKILVAFWDGKSKGTKHMIDTATIIGLETHIIEVDE